MSACVVSMEWMIIKLRRDKKFLKIYEQQEQLIYKQERVLNVYERWIAASQDEKNISDYLLRHNYHNVAIYGLGRLGKQLYNELVNSEINVPYVIDQNYSIDQKYYNQIYCYHPEDKLPFVDLVIVTVPGEEKEIVSWLKKKSVGSVKTMNDLLFVI